MALGDAGDIGYPDRLRISGASGTTGTQDPATGAWTPGAAPAVLYDGPALIQDMPVVVRRDQDGRPLEEADAKAFLPEDAASVIPVLATGQPVLATWADGTSRGGQVTGARRLDRVVLLQGVGAR